MHDARPLVVHIIHRLGVGGLENGLVNLINKMPTDLYKHAIICMTEYTDYRKKIKHHDVVVYALNKKEGHDFAVYIRLWKLIRKLKPAIVHTRNIAALECALPALLAGVRVRVHGEHGRAMYDLKGDNKKHNLIRKLYIPVVSRFIALSKDLENWLINEIGVPKQKISQVYNGVDTDKFKPATKLKPEIFGVNAITNDTIVIGTVGRFQGEKDQLTLVKAFKEFVGEKKEDAKNIHLVLVGDGPLKGQLEEYITKHNLSSLVHLMGIRDDVVKLLQAMDIFVLPSLAEGISNTILESMASGLPVIATNVGGNSELIVNSETGILVPVAQPKALAKAISVYCENRELRENHGVNARIRAKELFSLEAMVNNYVRVYDELLRES